ncbi:polyprenyl synthetase family protein [Streptomyces sp. NPDC001889]
MTLLPANEELDLQLLKRPVEDVLAGFLAVKRARNTASRLPDLTTALRDFVMAGGKRLRPVLTLVGWHAAGAHGAPSTVHHLAASLELFHAFALIHDDVMDRSDTRRGQPTIHRTFAQQHTGPGTAHAAERFGEGAAILVGDLALVWSDELLHAGHPTPAQLDNVLPLLAEMRSEVAFGQFLDLEAGGTTHHSVETALNVIRYKTAKYTIERPLHLGAALAGAGHTTLEQLSAYAIPLGEAFQLRDDLLGVFGDPATTGKPALDDLREGKATVLIALALERAHPAQAATLRHYLGNPALTEDQAHAARRIITATGADLFVEEMITERYEQALFSLRRAPFAVPAVQALSRLADSAVRRHT